MADTQVNTPEVVVMRPVELRKAMGLSNTRFYALQQRGEFLHLKHEAVSKTLGATRYNRRKVQAYLADRSK